MNASTSAAVIAAVDAAEERKIVTFALGQQMFGIDMSALIEIREWEPPTPLPGVPAYIRGVANLRGTVIPVVGLAERLGWAPSVIHARSCILVVNIAGRQAGFLVDEVADIVIIRSSEVQPAPEVESVESSLISGIVQVVTRGTAGDRDNAGTMVSLLGVDALALGKTMDLVA